MKKIIGLLLMILMLTGCSTSTYTGGNDFCFDSDGDGEYSCYERYEDSNYNSDIIYDDVRNW